MKFNEAWENMIFEDDFDNPVVEINFCNDIDGQARATMAVPRLYKDTDKTKADLMLAWETFCRPYAEQRLESITSIMVTDEKSIEQRLGRKSA